MQSCCGRIVRVMFGTLVNYDIVVGLMGLAFLAKLVGGTAAKHKTHGLLLHV